MNALIHSHSGLRWIVLILLIIAVFNSLSKLKSSNFTSVDKKINLFTLIFFHTQFLLGIILYFVSIKVQFFDGWMKDSFFRFYGMEHAVMMLIAFVLITMGYSKSKKAVTPQKKHKAIAVFYTISLILILAAIPWPFRSSCWFMVLKVSIVFLCFIGLISCSGEVKDGNNSELGSLPDGEELYRANCTVCHGIDGTLGNAGSKNLTQSILQFQELKTVIESGTEKGMPRFKEILGGEAEVEAVAEYVITLRK